MMECFVSTPLQSGLGQRKRASIANCPEGLSVLTADLNVLDSTNEVRALDSD